MAALLFFVILYGFIIYPLTGSQGRADTLAAWSFSFVLVFGVLATTRHKAVRMCMVTLATLDFASHWLHFLIRAHSLHIISAAAPAVFSLVLAAPITARVFHSGGITIFRIYGAIAVCVILGVL